jgi:hypothetical protein
MAQAEPEGEQHPGPDCHIFAYRMRSCRRRVSAAGRGICQRKGFRFDLLRGPWPTRTSLPRHHRREATKPMVPLRLRLELT